MANEMVNAIKGNDRLDIRAVATAGDAVVAANVTAAASAITALSTEVKGTGWTSGMTLKAHDDAINSHTMSIYALKRSGTEVAVGGAANESNRDIVLTIKNGAGTPAAVASYAVVGVKVTKSSVGGADSGDPAVINTDLDTANGLTVVAAKGEKIPAGAIADSANASLVAITKANGTLTVNIKKTTTNSKFFVHFILPDGTVKTSAIVELNAP